MLLDAICQYYQVILHVLSEDELYAISEVMGKGIKRRTRNLDTQPNSSTASGLEILAYIIANVHLKRKLNQSRGQLDQPLSRPSRMEKDCD
jgi:hypothetical protein